MTCGSNDCETEALVTALWPGQEIAMCLRCATGLKRAAEALGFTLHFAPLTVAAEPLAQEVEEMLGGGATHYDPEDGALSSPERRR